MDVLHEMNNKLVSDLHNQLEEVIINGLKLKGHSFDSEKDLHEFIKCRCSCVDYSNEQCKIYSIDDVAFLEHNYKINMEFDYKEPLTVKANYGTYRYL